MFDQVKSHTANHGQTCNSIISIYFISNNYFMYNIVQILYKMICLLTIALIVDYLAT